MPTVAAIKSGRSGIVNVWEILQLFYNNRMQKILGALFITIIFFGLCFSVNADELDDISHELDKLNRELEDSKKATKPLEEDLDRLRKQLSNIKSQISNIESDIVLREKQIVTAEKALEKQKEIIDERINAHYKNIKKAEASLIDILITDNLSISLQNFFYQKKAADNDKQTILRIVLYIKNIDDKKTELASEKNRLAQVKQTVDEQSQFLSGEIGKAKDFQAELSGRIASLTTRQQQLIGQKLASLNIPRSAGTSSRGCSSDLTNGRDPGFSPAIGFFTYGTFAIEDYVKRIYEVPDSWTDNNLAVLKAQAVAARTYGLNSMQRNGHICTTEACQVFKAEPKGGNWEQAVEATKGWVLMDGGNPGFTQYASTHGGYILNLGKFDGS